VAGDVATLTPSTNTTPFSTPLTLDGCHRAVVIGAFQATVPVAASTANSPSTPPDSVTRSPTA